MFEARHGLFFRSITEYLETQSWLQVSGRIQIDKYHGDPTVNRDY